MTGLTVHFTCHQRDRFAARAIEAGRRQAGGTWKLLSSEGRRVFALAQMVELMGAQGRDAEVASSAWNDVADEITCRLTALGAQ